MAEERRGLDRAGKARQRRETVGFDANMPAARGNNTQEAAAARSGQAGSAVVIEDMVASALEAGTDATIVDVRSMQLAGDVESQRSTKGAGARQEKEDGVAVTAPSTGEGGPAAVADAVAVSATAQAGDEGMTKGEEMIERLRAEHLVMHGELIAEKTAHSCALKGKECAEHERDGLEAKVQRARRECEKSADAVHRVQSGTDELQGLVMNNSADL